MSPKKTPSTPSGGQPTTTMADMQHILEIVFALQPGSPLYHALGYCVYATFEDFILEPDEVLSDLTYIGTNGDIINIPKSIAGLLRTFKQFLAHVYQEATIIDWKSNTKADFNAFRAGNATFATPNLPISSQTSTIWHLPIYDLVKEFKCDIKHDITQFPTLNDDAQWDN